MSTTKVRAMGAHRKSLPSRSWTAVGWHLHLSISISSIPSTCTNFQNHILKNWIALIVNNCVYLPSHVQTWEQDGSGGSCKDLVFCSKYNHIGNDSLSPHLPLGGMLFSVMWSWHWLTLKHQCHNIVIFHWINNHSMFIRTLFWARWWDTTVGKVVKLSQGVPWLKWINSQTLGGLAQGCIDKLTCIALWVYCDRLVSFRLAHHSWAVLLMHNMVKTRMSGPSMKETTDQKGCARMPNCGGGGTVRHFKWSLTGQ